MLSTVKYEFDPSYHEQIGASIGISTVGYRLNKYNPSEWHENNYAKHHQTFSDRDNSEKQHELNMKHFHSLNKLKIYQRTNYNNGLFTWSFLPRVRKLCFCRLHDINFWKFELNRMIEDVRNEIDLLVAQKKRLTNSLNATEAPLHIATESLANRHRCYGEDRVYDAVEVGLLKEVEIINNVQSLLRQTMITAEQQIRYLFALLNHLTSMVLR